MARTDFTDQHRIEVVSRIAKNIGSMMLAQDRSDLGISEKSNAKDTVTAADIKSQNTAIAELNREFPGEPVLSEEHTDAERAAIATPEAAATFTGWIVDPIDGTYNFTRDMAESSVSIGYIRDGKPQCGVIYDPYRDEMFTVIQGAGAYKNGERMQIVDRDELKGSSVATSNSYDDAAMSRNLRRHLAIHEQSGVMPWTSCPGSGVLIMAYVASGRFDVYHHNGTKPWDNAVGFLLVEEAGGKVVGLDGSAIPFVSNHFIMGAPGLVDRIAGLLVATNSADQSIYRLSEDV
jgi:myo-inositol-1(or 4)-monophosphatase